MDENRMRTYVALVLDRSGSMQGVKGPTVRGFNEQVQTLREEAKLMPTFVSLVTFASKISEDFWNTDAETLREMTEEQYNPSGGTALRDGVGYAINKLHQTTDVNNEYNSYLVVIMSDGEENESKEWSQEQLANRITELQNTNRWTFTYMGANVDLSKIQQQYNIPIGNTSSYVASAAGTRAAMNTNATQMKSFLRAKSAGQNSTTSFYTPNVEEANQDLMKILTK